MKITNNFGMPQPFVDFAINDKYSKGKADISVTSLIDSPKIRLMKDKYDDQIEVDAVDMVWALFGTAVHSVLEKSKQSDDIITEERLYKEVDGWVLSGAIDRQEFISNDDGSRTVNIIDYKVTSVWSVIYGKPEWENQLNCYAYLASKTNVGSLKVCAILRDWNRRDAEKKEDYPKAPIVFVDIPLWDKSKTEEYIKNRIRIHQEAQISFDLKGQKRAIRVLDSEEEANNYIDWHNETDQAYTKKTDLEIEFRSGEYTRCGNYCSVADFCKQKKEREQ
jgi:hypothetical protein